MTPGTTLRLGAVGVKFSYHSVMAGTSPP